jgi:hypothetical protein
MGGINYRLRLWVSLTQQGSQHGDHNFLSQR